MPIWIMHDSAPGGLTSAHDPSTDAWINQVVINGGSVSNARATVVDNFIVALKNAGLFTRFDRLYLHAAENQPSALTCLVSLTLATAVNSPSFTVDRGYTGVDASNVHLDTGFNPTVG
jgi:hypothetical protein